MIAYITDLPHRPSGGGSYAVNWHAREQLQRYFPVCAPDPITPEPSKWETLLSRVARRVLRRPGRFAYFSEATLAANARRVEAAVPGGAQAIFFRSASRWCAAKPTVPYFVYLDVVFHTFHHNTFTPGEFDSDDLQRIWDTEARFLENARSVFFESQWGLEQAREVYGLTGDHYTALGRGGVLDPPDGDAWDGECLDLVTIAMNFRQKGGDIVAEAFRQLKPRHPKLRWRIIGGEAPKEVFTRSKDIIHHGKLRPDDPGELRQFREILANAFLLLHPTREDTNPLVITEAAYFGCPAISMRQFGIPELIRDAETGLLLDAPATPAALADAIDRLLHDRGRYLAMRRQARAISLDQCSWNSIGDRMAKTIRQSLDQ